MKHETIKDHPITILHGSISDVAARLLALKELHSATHTDISMEVCLVNVFYGYELYTEALVRVYGVKS